MPFEVDYLPVGEGERSGDAICLRFGNLAGPRSEQTIMVIDGGDKTSGAALVDHIKKYYQTDHVDYVVSTHPDSDHASGLCTVMEELSVGILMMHRPWEHMVDIKEAFTDGRWTVRGLGEKVEKSLKHAKELEEIAVKKGVRIVEPFDGTATTDGVIRVLGPSKDFYQTMLTAFRGTPTSNIATGLLSAMFQKTKEAIKLISDQWHLDLLSDDDDTTSAENNTSAILLLTLGENRILFTADAGKTALLNAIAHAESMNVSLAGLHILHVPHHGSRRNLNSKILKKMNGSIAHISASGENEKHPSKRVVNALKKHGALEVNVNRKKSVLYHYLANHRGWNVPVIGEPFYSEVEE